MPGLREPEDWLEGVGQTRLYTAPVVGGVGTPKSGEPEDSANPSDAGVVKCMAALEVEKGSRAFSHGLPLVVKSAP
jgi:hypothetical protein